MVLTVEERLFRLERAVESNASQISMLASNTAKGEREMGGRVDRVRGDLHKLELQVNTMRARMLLLVALAAMVGGLIGDYISQLRPLLFGGP